MKPSTLRIRLGFCQQAREIHDLILLAFLDCQQAQLRRVSIGFACVLKAESTRKVREKYLGGGDFLYI